MEVNPSLPARTVPEFIAYAKANPAKINMASGGSGSAAHVCRRAVQNDDRRQHDSRALSRRALALTDLLGGQVQVHFAPYRIDRIYQGRQASRAGGDHRTRSEALPDIPTVGEFVPGYEASFWYGIGAPKSTPAEIVDKLNKEINAGLADPRMKARLAELGGTVLAGSPADFGKLIADETEKWGKVIRAAHIKADKAAAVPFLSLREPRQPMS